MFLDIKLLKDDEIMLEATNIPYTIDQNKIHFKLETFDHDIDLEQKTFQRESEEFNFFLDFQNNKCTYILKEVNGTFDIIVDDSFWLKEENKLELHYAIETEDEKSKILINFNN